ncbi:MAG: hypothetical protein R2712_03555 [Vicinamibacterales bacterium]
MGPSSEAIEAPLPHRARSLAPSVSRVAGIGALAVASLVLLGWVLDVAALKSVVPGLATMKFNTRLVLRIAGRRVWLSASTADVPNRLGGAVVCAGLVVLLAGITLVEWLTGIEQDSTNSSCTTR